LLILYVKRLNIKNKEIKNKEIIMETIKEILMRRDGNTSEEADERIEDALDELEEYTEYGKFTEAQNWFISEFGLEIEYFLELLELLDKRVKREFFEMSGIKL
jgi:hypothetical protein